MTLTLAEYEDFGRVTLIAESLLPKARHRFFAPPPPSDPTSGEILDDAKATKEELRSSLERILDFINSAIEIVKIHNDIREEGIKKASCSFL